GGFSGGGGSWRYALQAGHRQSDGFNAIVNPQNFSYNPDRDGYRNDNVNLSLAFRPAPEQEISAQAFKSRLDAQFDAGPGFDDRTITTVESYSIASRNRLATFWTSELSAAETGDDSSQFGGRTTGTFAYGYAVSEGLRATASFGTAFKTPTFNDLYYPGFSNPELKPESARNAELALRYSSNALSAGLVAYRNRVRDLIVFQCDANFNCAPQNVAEATLEGVTAELAGRVGELSAKASIDLQRPVDDTNGFLLPRRARRHAAFSLTRDAGPL